MKMLSPILLCAAITPGWSYARELACIPRSEMGETTNGEHLYNRDADLKIDNLSRIDFDLLTITGAEGQRNTIIKIADNVYRTAGAGGKLEYHYVTNDAKSIVTELSLSDTATYIKILLCK